MKQKKDTFRCIMSTVLWAMVCLVAGCSGSDVLIPDGLPEDETGHSTEAGTTLQFNVSIANDAQTRAVTEKSAFVGGENIGLYIYRKGTQTALNSNVKATVATGGKSLTFDNPPVITEEVDIKAHYPYRSDGIYTTHPTNGPYYTSTASASVSNANVQLAFGLQSAKVEIKIINWTKDDAIGKKLLGSKINVDEIEEKDIPKAAGSTVKYLLISKYLNPGSYSGVEIVEGCNLFPRKNLEKANRYQDAFDMKITRKTGVADYNKNFTARIPYNFTHIVYDINDVATAFNNSNGDNYYLQIEDIGDNANYDGQGKNFYGTYNGNGYRIGTTPNYLTENNHGNIIFCTRYGFMPETIKSNPAGICKKNEGTITDCFISTNENLSNQSIEGGICITNNGNIERCLIWGTTFMSGGICSDNSGTINNCYVETSYLKNKNTGYNAGGISARNYSNIYSCVVSLSEGTGNYVGGISGTNEPNGYILACCAKTNDVTSSNNGGGIVGYNHNDGLIYYCYWSSDKFSKGIGSGKDTNSTYKLSDSQPSSDSGMNGWGGEYWQRWGDDPLPIWYKP